MKRGDIDSITGLIYWGKGHEWLSPDKFAKYKATRRAFDIKWRKANPGLHAEKTKQWQKANPEKNRALRARVFRKNYYGSSFFRFRIAIRNRVTKMMRTRRRVKRSKTFEMIGCNPHFLRAYLEMKFTPGMTWLNHGAWHVDHETPLASAKDISEAEALCHFSNLQPLWAQDNYRKASKLSRSPMKETKTTRTLSNATEVMKKVRDQLPGVLEHMYLDRQWIWYCGPSLQHNVQARTVLKNLGFRFAPKGHPMKIGDKIINSQWGNSCQHPTRSYKKPSQRRPHSNTECEIDAVLAEI